MKIIWKKNTKKRSLPTPPPSLPFNQQDEDEDDQTTVPSTAQTTSSSRSQPNRDSELADSFRSQGNKLAEDRRFREALGKWEAALTLVPDRAVIHEQKAQVLLEIGDAWGALKAATLATELEPSWAEAWITLARAQLNFGEPEASIGSFDKALTIKPDSEEALDDRETALRLVKKRRRLQISGVDVVEGRFMDRGLLPSLFDFQGYIQHHDADYDETSMPVAKWRPLKYGCKLSNKVKTVFQRCSSIC